MPNNNDNEKYNWARAAHDYGNGWAHGFQSMGIAPSFLGADSLPQGLADLHWALHGIQGNMDELDAKMKTYDDNISKIANNMRDDIIKYIGSAFGDSKTPMTTETGYISKMLTTRQRIFADSWENETSMDPNSRIRGFTNNYNWIQYTQKNPTCEGEYDRIIDFNYVAEHRSPDNFRTHHVQKSKIILDKCGLIKRMHITQHRDCIVIWYLLTQTIPSATGVSYTGAIKRVEYNKYGELLKEQFVPTNHTPLVLLGAFSGDANDENEFIQYISTDYKVYQNVNGVDKEIGQLPNDVIMLIDPVNDIVSDSKQAYIMKYSNDGKLLMPLEGFTLVDTLSGKDIIPKFKIVKFENDTDLFKSFVSISPRNQTTLTRKFDPNEQMVVEGGYYVELYDDATNSDPGLCTASHIFLLSSTEEVYDLDRFSSNLYSYWSDTVSEFSMKRERDYFEFPNITFYDAGKRMFPEIFEDFGIPEDTLVTLEPKPSELREVVTFHLTEPFVLSRAFAQRPGGIANTYSREYALKNNNRYGYTVITNSDYVHDIADKATLALYRKLDFVNISNSRPNSRNYLEMTGNYDRSYTLPKYYRYRVVERSQYFGELGVVEITYFDENTSITATFSTTQDSPLGMIKYNENKNLRRAYIDDNGAEYYSTPNIANDYLFNVVSTDTLYFKETSRYLDKPYGVSSFTLHNETSKNKLIQRLYVGDDKNNCVIFTRSTATNVEPHSPSEWCGQGMIESPRHLHTAGRYHSNTGYSTAQIGTGNPDHEVFKNIISHDFTVDAVSSNYAHIEYTITNKIGLVMKYHNIAIREPRETNVPSTAKPYTLMYSKWIPGEYVGNDDYPYGPDTSAFNKEVLRRLTELENRQLEIQDTNSIDLTKSGDWKTNNVTRQWNPRTNTWTTSPNIVTLKADAKISSATTNVTFKGKTVSLPNNITVKDDGLYVPDYQQIISEIDKDIQTIVKPLESVVKDILSQLIKDGAWDPNKKPDKDKQDKTALTGGLKDGIGIAFGNINLFGGQPDGAHFIRTNGGSNEDDLAGGI